MTNLCRAPDDLWPLLDPQTLCNKQDQCVSCKQVQFHSYIHNSGRKKLLLMQNSKFYFIFFYKLWPLMTSDLCKRYCLPFWKAFITYYHKAKFQSSVINSLRENFNVKSFSAHPWKRQTNPKAMHQWRLTLLQKFVKIGIADKEHASLDNVSSPNSM